MTERAPGREVVRVDLGPRGYDVVVGPDLLARAGDEIKPLLAGPRVVIVSDANVEPLYGPRLSAALEARGVECRSLTVAAGEESKCFAELERLIDALLEARPDRRLAVAALGGGVIGDLAGFAASILLRGVACIQIPTTLLAQVDSALGGKTGINTRHGKNLVGSFHQPRLVLADTTTLDSLPARELRAGYAEVVKYGLIGDAGFFDWLENQGARVLAGDGDARQRAIVTSCRAKARMVEADERESGARALLNLGHTFGHAFERAAGFDSALRHGEAVAIGLVLAFRLSSRLGLCSPDEAARIAIHLESVGLPTGPNSLFDRGWTSDSLLGHMGFDKKSRSGRIRFVLARGIGRCFVADDVPLAEARAVLDAALGGPGDSTERRAG